MVVALVLTVIVVIATKAGPGAGRRCGAAVRPCAVAFAGWMAATYRR
jgi:hypothetical protein